MFSIDKGLMDGPLGPHRHRSLGISPWLALGCKSAAGQLVSFGEGQARLRKPSNTRISSAPRSPPRMGSCSMGCARFASRGQRSCVFGENDPAGPGYLLCTSTRALTTEPARKRLVFTQKPFAAGCPGLRARKGAAGASCACTFILCKSRSFCWVSAAHFRNDLIRG